MYSRMFDADQHLNRFYEEELRLGTEGRQKLAKLRDLNLQRLRRGLEKLGPMRGAATSVFESHRDQGSYAMHTLNQHPDGDYDIDTAVIFDASALPSSPLDARKRVAEALLKDGPTFARAPEARLNAVTVWYAEGHHVDLAVYRKKADGTLEHAGAEWSARDPSEVTAWFTERVAALSPAGPEVKVGDGQLRRIVRFVKRFCASRPSWSLPGGMITTTLVVEVFVPDAERDDVALRATLQALHARLCRSEVVLNPVNPAHQLTARAKCAGQVTRLRKRLAEVLPKLDVLDAATCDAPTALRAWNAVFRHDFFAQEAETVQTDAVPRLSVVMDLAPREDGPIIGRYLSTGPRLPKNVHIRFTLDRKLGFFETVRWTVENEGDEAEAANDLGHVKESSGTVTWRHTAYRGDHRMTCEVLAGGKVLGRCVRRVRVA